MSFFASKHGAAERSEAAEGLEAGVIFRCRSSPVRSAGSHLKLDQAKRFKDLERENDRLKRAVSELTLDKLILKEALEGKY